MESICDSVITKQEPFLHTKKRKYRNMLYYSILIADICVLYSLFVSVFNSKKCHLFPDAKISKDVTKHFIVCHFAYDFAKVVDGGAEVFAHEVATES